MGLVSIKFKSHNIQISSNDEERVKEVARMLDERIENSTHLKSSSDTKLLYLIALTLQDEVDNLKAELLNTKLKFSKELGENQSSLAQTLDYIAGYIEILAEKLEK